MMRTRVLAAILLAVLVLVTGTAEARAKFQGYAEQGGMRLLNVGVMGITRSTGSQQNPYSQQTYPGATVTVYNAGTLTPATIYSDNAGTAKSNPFTADSTAYWFFFADAATYDIKFSGTGITLAFTLTGVGAGGGGGSSGSTIDVSTLATSGSGATGNCWAGWEAGLPAYTVDDKRIHFPTGCYTQVSRVEIGKGWRITGDGEDSSVITSAFTGSAFRFDVDPANPFGLQQRSNISISDVGITNTNASNVGSGIVLVAATYVSISRVHIIGFRIGIAALSTQVLRVYASFIELQKKTGLWLVNNGDYNIATNGMDLNYSACPSGGTNVVHVLDTWFNNVSTAGLTGIQNDGAISFVLSGGSFNGTNVAVHIAASSMSVLHAVYFEGQGADSIQLETTSLFGNSIGPNGVVKLSGCWFSGPWSGSSAPVYTASVVTLDLAGNSAGGSSPFIRNAAGANTVVNWRSQAGGNLFDSGTSTRYLDCGSGASSIDCTTNGALKAQDFYFKDRQMQSWVNTLTNTAGTLQARFAGDSAGSTTAVDVAEITGAPGAATLFNIVTVDTAVAFADGIGISSDFTNCLVYNVSTTAKIDATTEIEVNSTTTALTVSPMLRTENVNGVSQARFYLCYFNATSGAAFALTAGNIGSGTLLTTRVRGFLD